MHKLLLSIAAIAAATLLGAGPSRAYSGAWCAVESTGLESVSERCAFRDFETCRREVVSGNRGFCRPSQYGPGVDASPAPRREPRRRARD